MLHFNGTSIEAGFIKNLLHDYNLPTIKVATSSIPLINNQVYIQGNEIFQYVNESKKHVRNYIPGQLIVNYTSRLNISGINYDSKTHEYLGNYLRFLRDYYGYNLMSMYNCYSNSFPKQMNAKFTLDLGGISNKNIQFTTRDTTYKIIMVPVKLGQTYTIAIDSMTGIEMFAGYYGKYYYNLYNLPEISYKKINCTHFNNTIIYDNLAVYKYDSKSKRPTTTKTDLFNSPYLSNFAQSDKELKLFIKIPFDNTSSITILEGAFDNNKMEMDWNNPFRFNCPELKVNYKKANGTEDDGTFKVAELTKEDVEGIKLQTNNQLLSMNCEISHPISARLLEYLNENVISSFDKNGDNIKRVQAELVRNYNDKMKINQEHPTYEIITNWATGAKEVLDNRSSTNVGLYTYPQYYGVWTPKDKLICYQVGVQKHLTTNRYDVLGYVDKDIESALGEEINIYEEDK